MVVILFGVLSADIILLNKILSGLILTFALGKSYTIINMEATVKKKMCIRDSYNIEEGYGIYTDMNAIRSDEELGNLHSLYVDQWDWERVMSPKERNVEFLKEIVRCV